MKKLLTISIANYNNASKLPRCLSSLIIPNIIDQLDIIVVNDGSNDNSKEIILDFVNQYPGSFSLIDKPNGGYGSTVNASLKKAKGKYFKLLDADDYFDEGSLKSLVDALDSIESDIIYTDFYYENNSINKLELVKYNFEINKELPIEKLDNVHMHSIAVKTDLIKDKITLTENSFYVDIEFSIKVVELASNFIYLPLPIYQYQIGDNEQSVSRKGYIKHAHEHEAVLKKILEITQNNSKFNLINKNQIDSLAVDQLFIYMFDKKYINDFYSYKEYLVSTYPKLIKKAKLYIKLSSKSKFFYKLFSKLIKH